LLYSAAFVKNAIALVTYKYLKKIPGLLKSVQNKLFFYSKRLMFFLLIVLLISRALIKYLLFNAFKSDRLLLRSC